MLVVAVLSASAAASVAAPASARALCSGYFSDAGRVSGSAICNTMYEYEVHVTCSDGFSFVSFPEPLGYAYFTCSGHGSISNAVAWIWYNAVRTRPEPIEIAMS
ncbi:hypothetical protein BKM31_19710 [[Actinomadura] parvosata subsp. kistnae]|uniref:Ig-like domain-containing protein n=1 Tax=[Actinomadura] parvosata subsp. kistnae TaxID=1909395 RepID=A0A1U9ZZM4_9ACTN|nr:hypothetical protein BKM31_19710 [Nonomuraea sp. ATCC 55076]